MTGFTIQRVERSSHQFHPTTEAEAVVRYYDELAERYDADRFGNSYGRYVDAQERTILKAWLGDFSNRRVLDLACGSGRLLDFAAHGLDASEAMVRIAREKHPGKDVRRGIADDLTQWPFQFDAIFCVHLFMHLPLVAIGTILRACHQKLRPGGLMIFDAPSARRCKLTGFKTPGWHAGTALKFRDVGDLAGAGWRIKACRGVLLFPIHRLPSGFRPLLRPLDDVLGRTPLKSWSSYLFF